MFAGVKYYCTYCNDQDMSIMTGSLARFFHAADPALLVPYDSRQVFESWKERLTFLPDGYGHVVAQAYFNSNSYLEFNEVKSGDAVSVDIGRIVLNGIALKMRAKS